MSKKKFLIIPEQIPTPEDFRVGQYETGGIYALAGIIALIVFPLVFWLVGGSW